MSSRPTVIVPFEGPGEDESERDVFVYLRPETNGVLVESALMQIIQRSDAYRKGIQLVYLANIPGGFMLREHVVERHYRFKLPFARRGAGAFTDSMKQRFEKHFGIPPSEARVLGAFEAPAALGMSEEELFAVWVPSSDILTMNCQTVKKISDYYVVNYDIPALLHKNSAATDIAVMVFRTSLSAGVFHTMIEEMGRAVRERGIIGPEQDLGRAFHYSKGPFDHLLDAEGHLYNERGEHIDISNVQFCRFLQSRGLRCPEIKKALTYPIMTFRTPEGDVIEDCLFAYTRDESYSQAYAKYSSAVAQFLIR